MSKNQAWWRRPFDPHAPMDTIDGLVRDRTSSTEDLIAMDVAWLANMRRMALRDLRSRLPTGVDRSPGERIREATYRVLLKRDAVEESEWACLLSTCCICEIPTRVGLLSEIDHYVPLIRNGRHHIDNLGLAHGICNQFKSSKIEVSPVEVRTFLLEKLMRKYPHGSTYEDNVRAFMETQGELNGFQ